MERILISLSPADLKKEGAGFDLAVAIAVLDAKKNLDMGETLFDTEELERDSDILVMGELELNGNLRPVRGIHAAVSTAFAAGITKCIVAAENADEARTVRGMRVFGAENLAEAFSATESESLFTSIEEAGESESFLQYISGAQKVEGIYFPPLGSDEGFEDIEGQEKLVRGLQIAAAGGHSLLAFGPPGCGKTLSMTRFPSLLPLLSPEQSQSVTRIYSIAGLLNSGESNVKAAPFRQPHQTATIEGMCGGGMHCLPGEISLAHNGTLFLDEAAEFKATVLQMLRVPLETGAITLSRAGRSTVYPADFQLLLSTNPCPCGNFGSEEKICLCSSRSVEQYWKKFSAPLLDRIDIRVQVDGGARRSSEETKKHSTLELRRKIARAEKIQRRRQGKKNARLSPAETAGICTVTPEAKRLLANAAARYDFSSRAESMCLKISRTIADMEEREMIDEECMREAVEFRKPSGAMEVIR